MSDNARYMLLQWFQLEDVGMIDENDEGEVCNYEGEVCNDEGEVCNDEGEVCNDEGEVCNDISENPMDKAQVLSEVLPLLEKLYAYGARLSDCHILDAARQLCLRMKDSTKCPSFLKYSMQTLCVCVCVTH